MTSPADTGLLRHDRAFVIVRPQGHLIRPHAPQPAAITHVLDGIEPENAEPATAQNATITAKFKVRTLSIDQNIWMPYISCG